MSKQNVEFGKAFPYEYFGLTTVATANGQHLADCPFCGKEDRFYISADNGKYECKVCSESGNVYTFMRHFYKDLESESKSKTIAQKLEELAKDRSLKVETLLKYGVRYYSDQREWIFPVRNLSGEIVNLRIYHPGTLKTKGKGRALTGVPLSLGGLETVKEGVETIWLCEGEWDAMALSEMLSVIDDHKEAILWLPGAGTFKDSWLEVFRDKRIVLVYDKDRAGFAGRKKVASILQEAGIKENDILTVDWHQVSGAKDGYDLRDFYIAGNGFEELLNLIITVPKEDFVNRQENINEIISKFPHISERKLTWANVIAEFEKHYRISKRLEFGLKMMTANVYSLNIKDTTPNWQHIVSPAGSAKTEWVNSFGQCAHVHIISNTTAKSLVSGFAMRKGNDPSLIPKVIGKCLMIKDFTEILDMHRGDQEEMMGVLRGAYDGYIVKQFGNGVVRKYEDCQFNIISACTRAIYTDNKAAMGERFLKFTMIEGNDYEDIDDVLISAAGQTGREKTIRTTVQGVMKEFCEVRFDYTELPELDSSDLAMLTAVTRLLASFRVQVQTAERTDILLYRPQIEYGTRPMKVLTLVLRCLGMVNGPDMNYRVTDEDRKIVVQNAISSMTPFTFEIARAVYRAGEVGLNTNELQEICKLKHRKSTLDYYRNLLEIVDVIQSYKGEPDSERGPIPNYYVMNKKYRDLWEKARIEDFADDKIHDVTKIKRQKNRMKTGKFRIKKAEKAES